MPWDAFLNASFTKFFSPLALLLQHVISADVDEPWPLEIYDRQGNAVNITMEPGDMVLYGKFCRILLIGMNIKCNFFLVHAVSSAIFTLFHQHESVESHSLLHGRPFPLKGRYFSNIFIHFEPCKWVCIRSLLHSLP